jgi:hypothetical protein
MKYFKNEKQFMLILLFTLGVLFHFVSCDYFSIPLNKNKQDIRREIKSMSLLEYENEEKKLFHQLHNHNDINSFSNLINQIDKKIASVPITNYFNIQYYGNVYIGSNFQEMSVIFDTGSNILWVSSNKCMNCRNFTSKYAEEESITHKDLNITKNITYAIGFVNGTLVEDEVFIGKMQNLENNNNQYYMGASNFKFLVVDYESELDGTIADGVLGLGIDTEGDERMSFIYTLYNQNKINRPQFSFYLTDSKKDSRIYIGDITENFYLKPEFDKMSYCNVNNRSHYWQCDLENIRIKSKSIQNENLNHTFNNTLINNTLETSSKVIFDTGTSYLIIPVYDFVGILPHFLNNALDNKCGITPYFQFICKCNSPEEFDDIVLHIGSNSFIIPTENIIEFFPTLEYQCRFEIIIDLFMMDAWILGDSVLRNTLLTFDMNDRRIGYLQDMVRISDDIILSQDNSNSSENGDDNYSNYIFYTLLIITICAFTFLIIRGAFYYADRARSQREISSSPLAQLNQARDPILNPQNQNTN